MIPDSVTLLSPCLPHGSRLPNGSSELRPCVFHLEPFDLPRLFLELRSGLAPSATTLVTYCHIVEKLIENLIPCTQRNCNTQVHPNDSYGYGFECFAFAQAKEAIARPDVAKNKKIVPRSPRRAITVSTSSSSSSKTEERGSHAASFVCLCSQRSALPVPIGTHLFHLRYFNERSMVCF